MKYTTHEVELKPGATITIPKDALIGQVYPGNDGPVLIYSTPVPLTSLQRAAEHDATFIEHHRTTKWYIHLAGFNSREEAQAALDSLKAGAGE